MQSANVMLWDKNDTERAVNWRIWKRQVLFYGRIYASSQRLLIYHIWAHYKEFIIIHETQTRMWMQETWNAGQGIRFNYTAKMLMDYADGDGDDFEDVAAKKTTTGLAKVRR